jgi:hypothetical protein
MIDNYRYSRSKRNEREGRGATTSAQEEETIEAGTSYFHYVSVFIEKIIQGM